MCSPCPKLSVYIIILFCLLIQYGRACVCVNRSSGALTGRILVILNNVSYMEMRFDWSGSYCYFELEEECKCLQVSSGTIY